MRRTEWTTDILSGNIVPHDYFTAGSAASQSSIPNSTHVHSFINSSRFHVFRTVNSILVPVMCFRTYSLTPFTNSTQGCSHFSQRNNKKVHKAQHKIKVSFIPKSWINQSHAEVNALFMCVFFMMDIWLRQLVWEMIADYWRGTTHQI